MMNNTRWIPPSPILLQCEETLLETITLKIWCRHKIYHITISHILLTIAISTPITFQVDTDINKAHPVVIFRKIHSLYQQQCRQIFLGHTDDNKILFASSIDRSNWWPQIICRKIIYICTDKFGMESILGQRLDVFD